MSQNKQPKLSGMDAGLYLRKSRMEEGLDTDTVLAKHQKALLDYARAHSIHILETYPEVVSGESLFARPQMLRLLEDVEEGRYGCVLVMDLDRLSRGRMKDQGIILDAFRESGTLIVTPEKVYDLEDEIDEEYAELKTFLSRREYKIINKRLRRGLQQSIDAGCYVANAPYGYQRAYVDRKPTLEICEPEAEFVRMMFALYTSGYGCISVARHINALGAKPRRGTEFNRTSVAKILSNPTYIGKVVWNQKKHIKKGGKGNAKHLTVRQPKDKWTVTDGIHPAIVDKEIFDKAQEIMTGRFIPSHRDGTVKSPLVGLVKCSNCGGNMQRMVLKQQAYLLCTRKGCCSGAKMDFVEQRVLEHLEQTLSRLTLTTSRTAQSHNTAILDTARCAIQKELAAARRQKNKLYDLLERGAYDIPTFRQRMEYTRARIADLERQELETTQAIARTADADVLASKICRVLECYGGADAPTRNALLKSVIGVILYTKSKKTKPTDFRLDIALNAF